MALAAGPRIPGLANIVRFGRRPLDLLRQWQTRYGDVFTVRMTGFGTGVYVVDPGRNPRAVHRRVVLEIAGALVMEVDAADDLDGDSARAGLGLAAARRLGRETAFAWVSRLGGAAAQPAFAFLDLLEQEGARRVGEAVGGPIADDDAVAVVQHERGWVLQRLAVEVEVQVIAAVALQAADLRGAELHAPDREEVPKRVLEGMRSLHVDDAGAVVRVHARLDALGRVDADVRRQRAQQAVDVDVQQRVDVELFLASGGNPDQLQPLGQMRVFRSPRRLVRLHRRLARLPPGA